MFEVSQYLWLIPTLPLAASALIAVLGNRWLRQHSHWPCVVACVASFLLSALAFLSVYTQGHDGHGGEGHHGGAAKVAVYYEWITIKSQTAHDFLDLGFTLRADALSAMMLVMITFISSLIAIYAIGYMHGDPGYPRFFAEVALFVFSMTLLVLGDNLLLLYAGWEGVGLCSYLLIGFWFTKPSAADAARKAFLVTRIGDVGLLIGIVLLWYHCGTLDYDTIFEHAPGLAPGLMFAICMLLFSGAVGKSAQFPLHVWLPDAMEGPTPVSALIHAATMVTAGVYLVARCTPLFVLSPEAQLVVACIGGFTSLLAALIALTQTDLKRVLAYSTLSQLGYMFLALGCAFSVEQSHGMRLATFAVVAAMFHLFTHAFFKALLFLSAGSVMHAMGGVIDMRRFGGLWRVLPQTHWTFLVGALALAAVPPFSGFWSKDEILGAAWQAGHYGPYPNLYLLLFAGGLLTAGLTGFYTFRAYFLTFWGELCVPAEAGQHGHGDEDTHAAHGHGAQTSPHPAKAISGRHHPEEQGHAHESPPVMTVPLIILAVFAAGVGLVLGPLAPAALSFAHFLEQTPGFPLAGDHALNVGLMFTSTVVGLLGIGIAWVMYVQQPGLAGKLAQRFPQLYQLSLNKFHIDELYVFFIVNPLTGLYHTAQALDQFLVDGLVDLIGQLPRLVGGLFRPVQNGLVQFYALAMVLGLTVFLLALVRSL